MWLAPRSVYCACRHRHLPAGGFLGPSRHQDGCDAVRLSACAVGGKENEPRKLSTRAEVRCSLEGNRRGGTPSRGDQMWRGSAAGTIPTNRGKAVADQRPLPRRGLGTEASSPRGVRRHLGLTLNEATSGNGQAKALIAGRHGVRTRRRPPGFVKRPAPCFPHLLNHIGTPAPTCSSTPSCIRNTRRCIDYLSRWPELYYAYPSRPRPDLRMYFRPPLRSGPSEFALVGWNDEEKLSTHLLFRHGDTNWANASRQ